MNRVRRYKSEKNLPWGKSVIVEIPEEFWTDEYLSGVWSIKYIGILCDHYEGGICVQPVTVSQAASPNCIIIPDITKASITVLDGKISDYR
jgi:hypothetical protein